MTLISSVHFVWVIPLACFLCIFIESDKARYFIMCVFGCTMILLGIHLDRGQEYEIKLINENKVEIKSFITGKTYYCAPEKITETIDKDNL